MKIAKLGNWRSAVVATAAAVALAGSLAGTARPAAADSIRWGVDIHIGGRGHGDYGFYYDDRYRRDRYYDDYRYRRDCDDDYRYRRDRHYDDYRYRRDRDYDDYRYRRR